ncbi:helix-turn-helix domain-containing protein [Filimonas effusa]|uniref:AraC family transcriptional regulator n=1 Tax=Filimonas effusa TaxID=2508721 RepID=A0A4Q1D9L2_9BACT|nr:helix-turn-helix domain-containing protein [Filimonas effusa]RXK86074.1 AraC family transcriptional regulator [Filimonas effusa]
MVEIFQNIREIYDFTPPCEELAPFIEFFSESSVHKSEMYFNNGHASVKMFPSWTPTLYINLGGSYQIDLENIRHTVNPGQDILILRNGETTRYNLRADRIYTIKFYPGGLEAVLGINQTSFTNQVIDLNYILPPKLLIQMKQPLCFQERTNLVQSFLLRSSGAARKKDYYLKMVNDAIGEYSATGMQLNTSQIAEKLFLTSKTINRYFHQAVGISPKSYFSILRARTALTAFMNNKTSFLPWEYGYYDMSHFNKEMVRFTRQKLTTQL